MRYFKSIFQYMTFLLIVGTCFTLPGCDVGGCGNSCKGGLFCPTSKEDCECVAGQRGCGGFSFNEKSGKCRIYSCDSCALLVGTCKQSNSIPKEHSLSEYISIFPLENGCDIFAGEYSELECEEIAYERQCESMKVVPSDDNSMPMECWFYDCQECSLNLPFYGEEILELPYKGGQ